MLEILHWLPIRQRIKYRVASLTWRCHLQGLAPAYLLDISRGHWGLVLPGGLCSWSRLFTPLLYGQFSGGHDEMELHFQKQCLLLESSLMSSFYNCFRPLFWPCCWSTALRLWSRHRAQCWSREHASL